MTNSLFEKRKKTKNRGRESIIKRWRKRLCLLCSLSRELRPRCFPEVTVFWTGAAELQRQREQGLLRLQQWVRILTGRGGGELIIKESFKSKRHSAQK